MRELSLFTGGGGSVLAGKLLGWRTIGYVEKEEYCQKIISQRIKDGIFDNAPIFGDIRAFLDQGFAKSYSGLVDVITAGFPCTPFSIAGKRKGKDDDRNKWPETIETIRTIRPQFAFLENVPGTISIGYFDKICGDLIEAGYDYRWCVLSAAAIGAPHKRERLWIAAYSKEFRRNSWGQNNTKEGKTGREFDRSCGKKDVPYSTSKGLEREIPESRTRKYYGLPSECDWWTVEPRMGRVVNGMANRSYRLKALGNGWVPLVAATAWNILTEDLI